MTDAFGNTRHEGLVRSFPPDISNTPCLACLSSFRLSPQPSSTRASATSLRTAAARAASVSPTCAARRSVIGTPRPLRRSSRRYHPHVYMVVSTSNGASSFACTRPLGKRSRHINGAPLKCDPLVDIRLFDVCTNILQSDRQISRSSLRSLRAYLTSHSARMGASSSVETT